MILICGDNTNCDFMQHGDAINTRTWVGILKFGILDMIRDNGKMYLVYYLMVKNLGSCLDRPLS